MIVPTEAVVPAMPKVCVIWPIPMPSTPKAAIANKPSRGIGERITMSIISGTAIAKRRAVSVSGGRLCNPSFVSGMDKLQITARLSMGMNWRAGMAIRDDYLGKGTFGFPA
jgi:hypothetical protein